jgi:valyl-tRNA synthetase
MDPGLSKAVVETFVRLHQDGLIYRGQRLVNWDPVLKTAISDLEVVSEEEDGFLWSIRYPLSDGSGSLVVATTRPETMLGDTAVMVHPEDERYAHLIGKSVALPLTGRTSPVIADDYVDREFGTGVVKVTPAHDFNDYAVGQRHALPMLNIFTPEAHVNDEAPEKYRGLDRVAARKAVLADLEALDLLVETKPHKLQVPRGDRTGQVIEPYLTDQWFVKMDWLGERGLALAEQGAVRFVPVNWINTYRHWMGNIQDWCISRQLWWGHRIPAWYDDAGNVYVGRDEDEVRVRHQLGFDLPLRQDDDVLETWFSSALWSHSTLGWPDATDMARYEFDKRLPTSVLVTGFDIIFFWVARMIMMTDHFTGRVPFKEVYITGLVRDKDGQKMSKSKGNILDPIDLIDGITLDALVAKRTTGLMKPTDAPKIEKATRKEFPDGIPAFGADALRFTFASLASHGRDIKFDLGRAEGYKNFCNKLWNAARFALLNVGDTSVDPGALPEPRTDAERWILSRLMHTAAEVRMQFAAYRFDLVSQALYEFAWNDFCDWFLELAKPALNGDDAAAAASTRHTLLYVLEQLLCLLHPLIPFVTEEIWQNLRRPLGLVAESISVRPYPEAEAVAGAGRQDGEYARAEDDIEWLKAVVTAVRRIRGEMNLAPARLIPLRLAGGNERDRARVARFEAQLRFLLRLDSIEWLAGETPASAAAVVGDLTLLVPLAGLIDLDAERVRLDKELARVVAEIGKSEAKLAKFGDKAPAAVVEQERTRLVDWTQQRDALQAQRDRLASA